LWVRRKRVQPEKEGAARWGLAWSWRKSVLALARLLLVLDGIVAVSVRCRIRDLTIEEPEIEGIVRRIYEEGL
jgi:hypothetical protein